MASGHFLLGALENELGRGVGCRVAKPNKMIFVSFQ